MKRLTVLMFSLMASFVLSGQSISSYVVASAGESVEKDGVSISWTLGELAIETIEDSEGSVILTQGFQQGYFEITSVGEPLSNNFVIKIYPNPASEYVLVDLQSDQVKSAVVEMYDLQGKLVYNNKYDAMEGPNRIELSGLNSSQYILRVVDSSGKVLQTFKLVKR